MAMTSPDQAVLLVGCGRMGGALLRGWLERRAAPSSIAVVEPSAASAGAFRDRPSVLLHADPSGLPNDFSPRLVLFAVKPQELDNVVPDYRRFVSPATVFLSIAAGKSIGYFEARLGEAAAVVRSMPNTPAAVGRAITVACANARVSADQRALCDRLLAAVGEVAWIAEERLLDPVTAVSGSGPAYVFLLAECLAVAGERAGLPGELAMRLARATVAGAGELLRQSSEPAAVLRHNVTSPGGTTAAALAVLMAKDGVEALMIEAVAAATRRARELAG
ncbi:MAG: pyrroline-5-carboxylate reductase [Pseudomonadota bacterium]